MVFRLVRWRRKSTRRTTRRGRLSLSILLLSRAHHGPPKERNIPLPIRFGMLSHTLTAPLGAWGEERAVREDGKDNSLLFEILLDGKACDVGSSVEATLLHEKEEEEGGQRA